MFKNYFKIAFRNLKNHKGYSLINLLGLTVGLAVCILIVLYIHDELTFDRFHPNNDRVFRIVESQTSTDLGLRRFGITSAPVGPAMVAQLPEVEKSACLIELGRMTVQNGDVRFYEEFIAADPDLFEILNFETVYGNNPAEQLHEPYTAVLTESMAKKYFGDVNPIGQQLITDRAADFEVVAVLKDMPANSHLQIDMFVSLATVGANARFGPFLQRWDVRGFQTYVLLNKPGDAGQVEAKLPALMASHLTDEEKNEQRSLSLQPLSRIHFYSADIEHERNDNKADIAYVYIFGAVAFFILLIACINYMNLATARSVNRAAEVGLRKVVGARRKQLVNQFLSESLIITFAAFLLANALVQNIMPFFNSFTGKNLSLGIAENSGILLGLLFLTVIVGLISGSYPALYLSSIQIIKVLKGSVSRSGGKAALRRGLVILQFVLSFAMVVATLVAFRQMDYIKSKRLGFNKDHLIVVDINSGQARGGFAAIRHEFLQAPDVRSVSVTSRVPGEWKTILEVEVLGEGASDTETRTMNFFGVDQYFLETFEVELARGRNFMETMTTDSSGIFINEAAAALLGFEDPIGKKLSVQRSENNRFDAHVIGVVKDFHFRSLHEKIGPLVLGHSHNPIHSIDYFTVKISGANIPATLEHLKKVHERYDATTPFEYHFLDQQIDHFYKTDLQVSTLFGLAGGLSIFVACLGLFGLAAFTAEQRTKEIGVRKVLGATVPQIIILLSKEFTRLVLIGFILGAPLAYWAMNEWLNEFAYSSALSANSFLMAGAVVLLIAWITVSYQAVRAALTNPTNSLRYE